jgi:hypothetical protein
MIKSVTKPRMKLMKNTHTHLAKLFLAAALFAASGQMFLAVGQNAATPEQQQKEKWSKALTNARQDFLNSNDRESAEFVGTILESLDKPGGLSPAALAAQAKRGYQQVQKLVQRGALESAAMLNDALWAARCNFTPWTDGPAHPKRAGGSPGPGGLVLYLPFDAPAEGGVTRDASGAGNDGRVFGATWEAGGKFGGAYRFSLTNLTDRIVIADNDSLNVPYVTVAAWVNTTDADGFVNRIVEKDYRRSFNLCLGGGKQNRGKPGLEVNSYGAWSDRVIGDGRWHHVAGTFDGQVMRLYVDGVEQRQTKAGHPGPLSRNNWDVCVGNSIGEAVVGNFVAYDGLIDEVRIYNRALSAEEIKLLATATQAGVDVVPAPPADNSGKPSAADRLKQVKSLFDQGLINKEDYDKKRQEILDSM